MLPFAVHHPFAVAVVLPFAAVERSFEVAEHPLEHPSEHPSAAALALPFAAAVVVAAAAAVEQTEASAGQGLVERHAERYTWASAVERCSAELGAAVGAAAAFAAFERGEREPSAVEEAAGGLLESNLEAAGLEA